MITDKNGSKDKMELIHISTTLTAGINRRIIATTRGHEILMDVRKERGGDDAGPTPPECLAIALGGCIFNICRILAMEKQVELKDINLSISGDADPSRAFGMDTDTRAGFSQLSVQMHFSSKLSASEKEEFRRELLARCPLCDTVSNPTPLQIQFA
jgi:putative redox protein